MPRKRRAKPMINVSKIFNEEYCLSSTENCERAFSLKKNIGTRNNKININELILVISFSRKKNAKIDRRDKCRKNANISLVEK